MNCTKVLRLLRSVYKFKAICTTTLHKYTLSNPIHDKFVLLKLHSLKVMYNYQLHKMKFYYILLRYETIYIHDFVFSARESTRVTCPYQAH